MGWLSGYSQRKVLTIDQTKVDADLTNFPVLVKLTSARFDFSTADLNGFDVRFTSSDGETLIPYQRLRWDQTNDLADFFVMVPTVSGSTDTDFYAYWNGECGTRWDAFLLTDYVGASSGITYSVNRPTKSGSNPIFGDPANWTWDRSIHYVRVWKDDAWPSGSRYRMFYGAVDATGHYALCYAYSSDGLSWTKPNLGLYTYGGNTNNNIMLPPGVLGFMYYNPDGVAGQKYIVLVDTENDGGSIVSKIYGLDDDNPTSGNWVTLKDLALGDNRDPQSIVQRPDGRWLIHYQHGVMLNRRVIGATLSDTSDLTGTWRDLGIVLDSGVTLEEQRYTLSVQRMGGLYYATVSKFVNSTQQIPVIELWASQNGVDFKRVDTAWLSVGANTTWDDSMLFAGNWVQVDSTTLRYYYAGFPYIHNNGNPYDAQVGIAEISYQRIGYVSGDGGTLTTKLITPADGHLYLNCDANGGGEKIEVELLDAADSPIAGYEQADCTDVTADSYSTEVMWGANPLPTTACKIKFYFTGAGAKLHHYYIGDEANLVNDLSTRAFDTNYLMAAHGEDNPSTSYIRTSAGDMIGTKAGAGNPAVGDGPIYKSQSFNGSTSLINMGLRLNDYLGTRDPVTFEAWLKTSAVALGQIIANSDMSTPYRGLHFYMTAAGKLDFAAIYTAASGPGYADIVTTSATVNNNAWRYVAATYSGNGLPTGMSIYVDDAAVATTVGNDPVDPITAGDSTTNLQIGSRDGANQVFSGLTAEVRISRIVRSAAWLKATYNAQADTLLTYATELIVIPVKLHHLRQMGIC